MNHIVDYDETASPRNGVDLAPGPRDVGLSGRDFGGTLTQFVIGYLQGYTPAGTLDDVLRLAGETRTSDALSDVNGWCSYAELRRLLEAAGTVLGSGPAALGLVGQHVFDSLRSPELAETLIAVGSPEAVYKALSSVNESIAPACELTVEVTGTDECVVALRMRQPHEAFPEFCALQWGLLRAIPALFGYPAADVSEEECQSHGASCCRARLRWSSVDDNVARADRAEVQARVSEGRLLELQETVAQLVSGDGLQAVLTKVVSAARRALVAPSFVLHIAPTASFEGFTYAEGITRAEGVRVAAATGGRSAAGPSGNVLVAEVASDRGCYGQLVALRSASASFEPREQTVLDSYARLAASALDNGTSIVEARREAAAAKALLELSTSLVDLASSEEMVQRLVRAVPSVVDCDRVMVSLRDPDDGIVRVRAAWGFDPVTEAELRALEVSATAHLENPDALYRHRPATDNRLTPGTTGILAASGSCRAFSYAITSNVETFGWITVDVTSRPERFNDESALAERLRGLASQAAIAIRNSRLLEAIRHQALHDSLTGLPNRTLITDRVGQAIARARRNHSEVALFFIDLDAFKDVNDTLGHRTGDQLLRSVAARFAGTLRDSDTVARLGGDEFVVLAEGVSLASGPELLAERLLGVLAEPFRLGDGNRTTVSITASIGIAAGPRHSPEQLFADADVALYAAKDAGKNCYIIFETHMGDALRSRHEIETDLHAAVDHDQFFLVYQPIYDLETVAVTGVEALLRWQHPRRGLLQPDTFIPTLEATGLIIPVGRWVLLEACRQAAAWRERGHRLQMGVNVSARQLDSTCLLEDVRLALHTTGLPSHLLTIEITETCLMRDTKGALAQLQALKTLGVQIAIDDFGTGYSSLAYLQQFPVDCLKIDRSFISGMAQSPEGDALIHTLVQLGKSLNLQTLAEGIEQPEQLTQLQAEQCEVGQGYLFARPLPAHELEPYLRTPAGLAAT